MNTVVSSHRGFGLFHRFAQRNLNRSNWSQSPSCLRLDPDQFRGLLERDALVMDAAPLKSSHDFQGFAHRAALLREAIFWARDEGKANLRGMLSAKFGPQSCM